MFDLYLGIALSLTCSAGLCAAAYRIGRHLSRVTATVLVILLTAFLFWHATRFTDELRAARLLPFSNAIILTNFTPLAVGLIVGFAWRLIPGRILRRGFVLMPMVGVCLYKAYAPAFVTVPTLGDRWDHGVCLQTSRESCSPAAAATLLYAHGIRATEQEMATLCLTSHDGTSMLGLYRGLKIKTAGTPWDVEVFRGTIPQFRGLGGAMLISAGLKSDQHADPRYARDWGWEPGVKHSVVVFDFPGTEVDVGDPAAGREQWTLHDLQTLWYGEGLRLIKRPKTQ
jgi:hypothetical protein